jgi:hypothetical protein
VLAPNAAGAQSPLALPGVSTAWIASRSDHAPSPPIVSSNVDVTVSVAAAAGVTTVIAAVIVTNASTRPRSMSPPGSGSAPAARADAFDFDALKRRRGGESYAVGFWIVNVTLTVRPARPCNRGVAWST